jgi:hypothetical protein
MGGCVGEQSCASRGCGCADIAPSAGCGACHCHPVPTVWTAEAAGSSGDDRADCRLTSHAAQRCGTCPCRRYSPHFCTASSSPHRPPPPPWRSSRGGCCGGGRCLTSRVGCTSSISGLSASMTATASSTPMPTHSGHAFFATDPIAGPTYGLSSSAPAAAPASASSVAGAAADAAPAPPAGADVASPSTDGSSRSTHQRTGPPRATSATMAGFSAAGSVAITGTTSGGRAAHGRGGEGLQIDSSGKVAGLAWRGWGVGRRRDLDRTRRRINRMLHYALMLLQSRIVPQCKRLSRRNRSHD